MLNALSEAPGTPDIPIWLGKLILLVPIPTSIRVDLKPCSGVSSVEYTGEYPLLDLSVPEFLNKMSIFSDWTNCKTAKFVKSFSREVSETLGLSPFSASISGKELSKSSQIQICKCGIGRFGNRFLATCIGWKNSFLSLFICGSPIIKGANLPNPSFCNCLILDNHYSIKVKDYIKRRMKLGVKNKLFVFLIMTKIGRFFALKVPKRYKFIIFSGVLTPRIVPVRIIGIPMYIEVSYHDDYFYYSIMDGLQSWESEVLSKWLEILKNRPGVAIDVGGYFGIYSLVAGLGANRKIISYEPNNLAFEKLVQNVRRNNAGQWITPRNFAISGNEGNTILISPKGRPLSSGVQIVDAPTGRNFDEWEPIGNIEVTTLDEDIKRLGVDSISAIKIDVEGNEIEVLKGATHILTESKPTIIIECLNYEQLKSVHLFLQAFGYGKPVALDGSKNASRRATDQIGSRNFLFINLD